MPGDRLGISVHPRAGIFGHFEWHDLRVAEREPSSRSSPLLPGLKSTLDALLDQEDPLDAVFTEEQERSRVQAANNFRRSEPDLLAQATPYLWEYYRATMAEYSPEQRKEYGIPLVTPSTDIWTQVSITTPPTVELGRPPLSPARAYISFEGEVSWEPEHGLQLVVKDGLRVCKVGPYDGHVTNAHAFGDIALLGVVFKR
jgi:hypothetical protein